MFVSVVDVPGGIGVAVHLHVVAALLVVVGGGGDVVVVAVAAVDAGHQAVAAAGLGAADCRAGAAWKAAPSRGWELSGQQWLDVFLTFEHRSCVTENMINASS